MSDNYKYIDLAYLREASKDAAFLRKILSVFELEYRDLNKDLRRMFDEKDYEVMAESLHKAKSSVLMTTIPAARKRVIHLESLVKNGADRQSQKEALDDFIVVCDQAMDEISHAAKNV